MKNSLFKKINMMLYDIKIAYPLKSVLIFLAIAIFFSFLSIFRYEEKNIKEIIADTISFFSALTVIEIAFLSIFYSGNKGTEKAKKEYYNSQEEMTYYHYLLVKNYFSIAIKFGTIFIVFISRIFNISELVLNFNGVIIGFYNIVYIFIILSLLITVDLVVSMYYFLWGS